MEHVKKSRTWFDATGCPVVGRDTSRRRGGRVLPWAPSYKVYADGLVTRYDKVIPWFESARRVTVNLRNDKLKMHESKGVARLVGEMFCPEFRPHLKTRFKDGNHMNICADNLEWISDSEVVRTRTDAMAAKLTPDIVRWIRRSTQSNSALAAKYGLSAGYISQIKNRKYWKHI